MIKQCNTQGPRPIGKISCFKKYPLKKISTILIRNQLRQGFEILKIETNCQSCNQISSNKDTESTTKTQSVEIKYSVQVSFEKAKLTNKKGRQSLQILTDDLKYLQIQKKRPSLKEDIKWIKVENEKNIQEFNQKIQMSQQSLKLQQISQIIELQAFGPKILANELKKKRASIQLRRYNLQILLPILVLILLAFVQC